MNIRFSQTATAFSTSLAFGLLAALANIPARSQTILPAADGTATLVTPNGQQYDISGGSLSGDSRDDKDTQVQAG